MFDTHCLLNFKAFKNSYDQVIKDAYKVGVKNIVIPGTDIETSQKAVEIAEKYNGVYAAVGIHPHHVYQDQKSKIKDQKLKLKIKNINVGKTHYFSNPDVGADFMSARLLELEKLLIHPKVVAIGEVGIDKHQYSITKYQKYIVNNQFVQTQKDLLVRQIKLAIKCKKSLILHNREAKKEMLEILSTYWDKKLEGRTVFHCCEPDEGLLDFAIKHHIFIGVDGDVTYSKEKQEFVKKIPLEMLVLETDSPLLLPEPLRSKKLYPNKPGNLVLIVDYIAKLRKQSKELIIKQTVQNSLKLFSINFNSR